MKFKKDYKLKIIFITISIIILFTNALYPSQKESLRLRIGAGDDTYQRIKEIEQQNKIVSVRLIGVGSPGHYNMWNNVSLETLAGDLRGYFGRRVSVTISSANQVEEIERLLEEMEGTPQPDILGISVQPGSLDLVKKLMAGVKSKESFDADKTRIVFGNQLPTYFPEEFLEIYPEGIMVRGEGEIALRGLVEGRPFSDIPNLVYKDRVSGDTVQTHLETPDLELLEYPPSVDTYREIIGRGGNVQVQASRGCSWGGCIYCTRTSFRRSGIVKDKGVTHSWQGFPVGRVLKTLEDVISRGATEVEFLDDEFIGGRSDECVNRIKAIADGIERLRKKYNVNFTFRIFTRPDVIYKDKDSDNKNETMKQLLLRLKDLGLVRVFLGIEAGNPSQLKRYHRGMTLKENVIALNILRELQLGIDIGFIMFDPELSIEEMLENIRFFRGNQLMFYNQWPFRPLAINEGSRIVGKLREKGMLGDTDVNFMLYKYIFKDKDVEKIARIVEEVSVKTRTIFYALKVKSKKYFDLNKKDSETVLAQDYIEKNGHIYLDLMEQLCHIIKTGTEGEIEIIINRADKRALDLAKAIANDIANGKISDEDKYLTNRLAEAGITIHFEKNRSHGIIELDELFLSGTVKKCL